MAKYNMV